MILLLAMLNKDSKAQVCDATGDAIKNYSPARKNKIRTFSHQYIHSFAHPHILLSSYQMDCRHVSRQKEFISRRTYLALQTITPAKIDRRKNAGAVAPGEDQQMV
jgi:hypothetical protein